MASSLSAELLTYAAGRSSKVPRKPSRKRSAMRTKTLRICSLISLTVTALIAGAPNVSIRELDVPTPKARPHDPAVAPDGSLWYTGQMANKLGRLDPGTGKITEFPLNLGIDH